MVITPTHSAVKHRWRVFEALSMYMPALLMGVLAMGSYVLVRSTPNWRPVTDAVAAVRHAPDFVMHHFSVQRFDTTGTLGLRIQGDQGRHYADTQALEIDHAHMTAPTADQLWRTTATADQVHVNGDQTIIELRQRAIVERRSAQPTADSFALSNPPLMRLRGEHLTFNVPAHQLHSSQGVLIERGRDRMTAQQLDFDQQSGQLNMSGRVRAQLQATP
jgi:lipopolysaccharide export system protein LptC